MESLSKFLELFGRRKDTAPSHLVTEELALPALGPFTLKGSIKRRESLSPEHHGDTIGSNETTAVWVIDASCSQEFSLKGLDEASMARDLSAKLFALFDGSPLTAERLLEAINAIFTTDERQQWKGESVEYGVSLAGVYLGPDELTIFSIGTNTVDVGDVGGKNQRKIAAQGRFHNPDPPAGSKVEGNLTPTILRLPVKEVDFVLIHTDGIKNSYLPSSGKPIIDFIAPGATEAAVLELKKINTCRP